jgi:N-acetyl-anhydromuramyl-L-alanine amidase AmpD
MNQLLKHLHQTVFPIPIFQWEALQDCLQAFAQQSQQHLAQASLVRAIGYDDPEVQRRLADLGYLED